MLDGCANTVAILWSLFDPHPATGRITSLICSAMDSLRLVSRNSVYSDTVGFMLVMPEPIQHFIQQRIRAIAFGFTLCVALSCLILSLSMTPIYSASDQCKLFGKVTLHAAPLRAAAPNL
jgi:hypothetical protein